MTPDQLQNAVELSSNEELMALHSAIVEFPSANPDATDEELFACFCALCLVEREVEFRNVEPLWRKAKRFAIRNGGEIGRLAASAALGAFLGVELSD